MDKNTDETKPETTRRYSVSYRAESGSGLADVLSERGLKDEDSYEFEWDRPGFPSVCAALFRLLDARMSAHLVHGPITEALMDILWCAVEIKVSEVVA
jgi:hypothetical protein